MLPFRYQLLGHLSVALLLAVLLNVALQPVDSAPDNQQRATPFTTQADMLAVTVAVYQDAPPQILEVQPLAAGRISITQPGPYALALADEAGQALYELSFRVAFVLPGLGEKMDEARQTLVLPAIAGAVELVLTGPQGEIRYQLEDE